MLCVLLPTLNKHQWNWQMGVGVGGDKRGETGICGQRDARSVQVAARTARWHLRQRWGARLGGVICGGGGFSRRLDRSALARAVWAHACKRVDRLGSIRAWLWLRALHLRGLAGFHAVRPGTARA